MTLLRRVEFFGVAIWDSQRSVLGKRAFQSRWDRDLMKVRASKNKRHSSFGVLGLLSSLHRRLRKARLVTKVEKQKYCRLRQLEPKRPCRSDDTASGRQCPSSEKGGR